MSLVLPLQKQLTLRTAINVPSKYASALGRTDENFFWIQSYYSGFACKGFHEMPFEGRSKHMDPVSFVNYNKVNNYNNLRCDYYRRESRESASTTLRIIEEHLLLDLNRFSILRCTL
jgi:hypothetical protein